MKIFMNLPLRKGTGGPNKTEEESKQFMLQIFDLENFKEKLQHNFPKMRGGAVKGRLELCRNLSILVWPPVSKTLEDA